MLSSLQYMTKKMVPFLDLQAAYHELKHEIDNAVLRVMDSGWYVLGEEVENFEAEFASYCSADHCIGVANGLDALTLSLHALDIGPGDEVIVPSNTYIATWLAVSATGATPVPVEPDPITYNIDASRIEMAITERTRVILPVHLYGQPVDLDPILSLAAQYDLRIVEDAAQAHGARYRGTRIGAHGDLVCWSFYPGKNLGALGDAGAVTTRSADLATRLRKLRNYGSEKKYINDIKGVNSRLAPIQAAVLRVKLQYLDEWTERRRQIAALYSSTLKESDLVLPHTPNWAEPVWHLYVVRSQARERFQAALAERHIGTLIHYPLPPHMQTAYAEMNIAPDDLPLARQLSNEVISLPIGPHLQDAEAVVSAIKSISR